MPIQGISISLIAGITKLKEELRACAKKYATNLVGKNFIIIFLVSYKTFAFMVIS